MDPSCTLGFFCRDKADFEIFCAQVWNTFYLFHSHCSSFQWNHICKMTSEDRRVHSIFRIESGTFEENHTRAFTSEYPSVNDDDVLLRVTKLSSPHSSSLSLNKILPNNNSNKTHLINSSANQNSLYRDSWEDTGRSIADNPSTQLQSISDDYVFL